tara:strand:+ start:250 stop:624 length:375 start_codon:yes stop_codon:yes gene_type:complete
MKAIHEYLISSITLDGYADEDGTDYDAESMSDGEKIAAAKRNFESEMGWLIERSGQQKACTDWLAGLCSTVSIAFANNDIIKLAHATGGLNENSTEKDEDRICENYFPYMANNLLQLFRKEGSK